MTPERQAFLFGKLKAMTESIRVETDYLEGQDEDANIRLVGLIKKLETIVDELMTTETV